MGKRAGELGAGGETCKAERRAAANFPSPGPERKFSAERGQGDLETTLAGGRQGGGGLHGLRVGWGRPPSRDPAGAPDSQGHRSRVAVSG